MANALVLESRIPTKSYGALSLIVFFMLALSGCAAPLILMASGGSVGVYGYSEFKLSHGGTARFKIERSDPPEDVRKFIAKSNAVVIYPHLEGYDGSAVDVLRKDTNLEVISSTKAIQWIQDKGFPSLSNVSETEKHNIVKRLALAQGTPLALLVQQQEPKTKITPVVGTVTSIITIDTTIIRAQTGLVLWREQQILEIDGYVGPLGGQASKGELNQLIFKGVASRIMDIRRGPQPEIAKKTKEEKKPECNFLEKLLNKC